MTAKLGSIAVAIGCELRGDPDLEISHVATLTNAGKGALSFLANPQYKKFLPATKASAVVLSKNDTESFQGSALVSDNPYAAYAKAASFLFPPKQKAGEIHASAVVHDSAHIADSAWIGPQVVIEAGAVIGDGVVVGAGSVVMEAVTLLAGSRLVANVTLCHGVNIGERCIFHPGVVIGSDGFGIAQEAGGWIKVPQLGSVTIGNDVEIGANTCIDRGAIEDTKIGHGVKLDNHIQIAHNVVIGDHTVIAACTGVSGSTVIGRRCMIAGAVGFVGHLTIADDVVITGQTMVNQSIDKAGVYSSALPMDEARSWRRNAARFRKLDDWTKRIRALERKKDEQ